MGHATEKKYFGSKGQISLYFNYKVISKTFIPNFVCVLTNKRYKAYCGLNHAPGARLGSVGGAKI